MNITQSPWKRALLGAGFALAVALPLVAFADGHRGMHGGHGMGGPGMHGFAGPELHGLFRLDLTDAQRTQIRTLMSDNSEARQAKIDVLKKAHDDLRALAFSEQYDDTQARALADSATTAAAEMATMMAHTGHEIWKLLTPEQRQQLADMKAQHDERREERSANGESRRGGGRHHD